MNTKLASVSAAILIALIAIWGCSSSDDDNRRNAQTTDFPGLAACQLETDGFGPQGSANVRLEQVASGLRAPWGIDFLPSGDLLVSERPGRVRRLRNGVLTTVATISVGETGEGGLLGLAVHPDFSSNRFFYVYYTTTGNVNRVERYRMSEDLSRADPDRVILDGIPAGTFHNGGRIKFGPDGFLYVGTGDARNPELSQDPGSLAGKILRVDGNGDSRSVFISGIRNTQGFDWLTGNVLVVTDHGPSGELGRSGHDELNFAREGDNLGWPDQWRCDGVPGSVSPALVWERALPPGGMAIYDGSQVPEWRGNALIASLGGTHLQRVVLRTEGELATASHEVYFEGEFGRLREVAQGPDGELYVSTSNCDGRGSCPASGDEILRLVAG